MLLLLWPWSVELCLNLILFSPSSSSPVFGPFLGGERKIPLSLLDEKEDALFSPLSLFPEFVQCTRDTSKNNGLILIPSITFSRKHTTTTKTWRRDATRNADEEKTVLINMSEFFFFEKEKASFFTEKKTKEVFFLQVMWWCVVGSMEFLSPFPPSFSLTALFSPAAAPEDKYGWWRSKKEKLF